MDALGRPRRLQARLIQGIESPPALGANPSALRRGVVPMTKFKLAMAATAAAVLAFGVAACGQTTTVEEDPAAAADTATTDAAAPAEAPADPAAAPADPAAAPADGATTPPATTP